MPFRAPVADHLFLLTRVLGLDRLAATERFAAATPDLAAAILTEAGRLAADVLAPLNRAGDRPGARLVDGAVRAPEGFADGYRAIAEGGWIGMMADPAHGGMGLPAALGTPVNEMCSAACLALQLKPLLAQGQIEALEHHASPALKALYLPRLTSGRWSGTMNLTEPQAGSDVGAVRATAVDRGDGTHAVTGQKIYITWGDSDLVENVCHLVLARLPGGGEGTRGLSLFLVPKFLPDDAGRPGAPNALRVVSIERKLGLHGSPTCVMAYEGATGWLVGEAHRGMAAMFTMMNNARLGVGSQAVGVAEAAFQHALAHARDRRQGETAEPGEAAILGHPDVRRMLAEMRAEIFAARAITLACALALDMGRATGEAHWQARAALLTPIAKTMGTEAGCRVANLGVQVHGGMGFVEDAGAAQFLRDVRITPIYEGTNGIQAIDLVGRKLADGGEAAFRLIGEVEQGARAARARLPDLSADLWAAAEALREGTEAMLARPATDRLAGATPYLQAFGRVLGAHWHLAAALADPGRTALARVMIRRLLPEHAAALAAARDGAADLFALSADDLAAV
jgi:hypothetical protein